MGVLEPKLRILSEVKSLSRVRLFVTPQTVAYQATVHGIFQARVLEWVAISFSRVSSRPRDRTQVSLIVGRGFYHLSQGSPLRILRDDCTTFFEETPSSSGCEDSFTPPGLFALMIVQKWFQKGKIDDPQIFQVLRMETKIHFLYKSLKLYTMKSCVNISNQEKILIEKKDDSER